MNGRTLWDFLEAELKRREIRKAVFYEAIGITATAYYGRKNIENTHFVMCILSTI